MDRVTLEDAFWQGLKEIADSRQVTLSDLIGEIDAQRQPLVGDSAVRSKVLSQLSPVGAS